ncbi:MAG TPA: SpoIIE family protein phosphatase, partial [Blastocatellia bacterium]|nr:SpoIIE family protein phosphatase [Blastocatellia bacterium]
ATPRALIADDQVDVLEALYLLLKSEGYQTEAVTSPAAVLDALKTGSFDLLLMDLNYARDTTSGQEGLDLLSHVREIDSTLPIVVMTAWGSIELTVEAMRHGVRDFILKPWDNARLLSVLRTQIEFGHNLRKKERLKNERRILANRVMEAADLDAMLRAVTEHLVQALLCRNAVIFTKAGCGPALCPTAQFGLADDGETAFKFDPDSRLLELLRSPFVVREAELPAEESLKLAKIESDLVVPVRLKGEVCGFISLARKLSGEDYDGEELIFLEAISEQIGSSLANLRVRGQEVEEAKAIQQRLLPKAIPQLRGFEISCAWRPARAVSGDYYDVLRLNDSRLGLCIADVSGKGMPAALLMSNVPAAVKAFASEAVSPSELCDRVNRVVSSNMAEDKFITFFYCEVDSESKRLVYSNAGHNPALLVRRDGAVMRLEKGGAVLGPFRDWSYEQGEIDLSEGDRLLLFTDGITEATGPDDDEFGEQQLIELVMVNRELSAAGLQELVMRSVTRFSGGDFKDDATLIAVSVD